MHKNIQHRDTCLVLTICGHFDKKRLAWTLLEALTLLLGGRKVGQIAACSTPRAMPLLPSLTQKEEVSCQPRVKNLKFQCLNRNFLENQG